MFIRDRSEISGICRNLSRHNSHIFAHLRFNQKQDSLIDSIIEFDRRFWMYKNPDNCTIKSEYEASLSLTND